MENESKCLNYECSFCENDKCSYEGLPYEKPCYEDKGYFEDDEDK